MKDSTRDVNRIPKEQLTAYERWELPLLDARGNEVAREEEREVKQKSGLRRYPQGNRDQA